MNDTMLGADPQQLRNLAKDFSHAAQQLTQLSAALTQRINRPGGWNGPDADRFRSQWNGSYRTTISTAGRGFDQVATTLLRNAEEQDKASAVGGPGGAQGFPGTPLIPGGNVPVGLINKLLDNGMLADAEDLAAKYAGLTGITSLADWAGALRLKGGFESLESAMKFNKLAGALTTLKDFTGGTNWGALTQDASELFSDASVAGKIGSLAAPLAAVGRALGPAGAVLGFISVGTDLADKNYGRAGYDSVMTGLGVVALVPIPPVDLACGLAAGAMAVGELAYDHIPFVHDTVDTTVHLVGDGVDAVAHATSDAAGAIGDAASDLGHDAANAAKDLWPF